MQLSYDDREVAVKFVNLMFLKLEQKQQVFDMLVHWAENLPVPQPRPHSTWERDQYRKALETIAAGDTSDPSEIAKKALVVQADPTYPGGL